MNWRLFVGASILSVGLLIKIGAPLPAIVGGVALAAFISWLTRPNGKPSAGGSR